MAILPPGVRAGQFEAAIRAFGDAVGREWVYTSEEDLGPYRDSFSTVWNTGEERRASAAVAPDTVEQVQAIVRIAGRHRIPLFPISTGKNFGYGGPSPNLHGSVVVDLKRMNRVLEVDEERHFALVEAGVSYFDLHRHIQERGLKVWLDCPDPGWGSPVGNSLERGIGYTSPFYRDHFGASCGMEVVLANGEVMRTGMGALPGARTWQDYRYGFGPDPAGLFAQGNFGIVTKMGFRLMPRPEHYRTGLVTVPRRRDFIQLVKTVNYLSDSFLIGEPVYASPLAALMGDAGFRAAITRPGGASEAEMDRYASEHHLPAWQVELQFYGPEKSCLANWEYASERLLGEIPGARATAGESLAVPLTPRQLDNVDAPYRSSIRRQPKHSRGVGRNSSHQTMLHATRPSLLRAECGLGHDAGSTRTSSAAASASFSCTASINDTLATRDSDRLDSWPQRAPNEHGRDLPNSLSPAAFANARTRAVGRTRVRS